MLKKRRNSDPNQDQIQNIQKEEYDEVKTEQKKNEIEKHQEPVLQKEKSIELSENKAEIQNEKPPANPLLQRVTSEEINSRKDSHEAQENKEQDEGEISKSQIKAEKAIEQKKALFMSTPMKPPKKEKDMVKSEAFPAPLKEKSKKAKTHSIDLDVMRNSTAAETFTHLKNGKITDFYIILELLGEGFSFLNFL